MTFNVPLFQTVANRDDYCFRRNRSWEINSDGFTVQHQFRVDTIYAQFAECKTQGTHVRITREQRSA